MNYLKAKGLPDFKVRLSTEEEEVWTYRSTKAEEDTSFRMDVGRGQSAQGIRRPIISWTETVRLTIGKHGIVKNVSARVDYSYP